MSARARGDGGEIARMLDVENHTRMFGTAQLEVTLKRMPLVRLLDKKFMYDMFNKAVELAKRDNDADEVDTLQRGLDVWTKTTLEDQHHDNEVESNISSLKQDGLKIIDQLEGALSGGPGAGGSIVSVNKELDDARAAHQIALVAMQKELEVARAALLEVQRLSFVVVCVYRRVGGCLEATRAWYLGCNTGTHATSEFTLKMPRRALTALYSQRDTPAVALSMLQVRRRNSRRGHRGSFVEWGKEGFYRATAT